MGSRLALSYSSLRLTYSSDISTVRLAIWLSLGWGLLTWSWGISCSILGFGTVHMITVRPLLAESGASQDTTCSSWNKHVQMLLLDLHVTSSLWCHLIGTELVRLLTHVFCTNEIAIFSNYSWYKTTKRKIGYKPLILKLWILQSPVSSTLSPHINHNTKI